MIAVNRQEAVQPTRKEGGRPASPMGIPDHRCADAARREPLPKGDGAVRVKFDVITVAP
jgi:hypothetical protein